MGISNTHHIQVVLTEDKNLKEALSDIDVSTIKRLIIKGYFNCDSIKYLHKKMSATLVELDISDANIINDTNPDCIYEYEGEEWIYIFGSSDFKKLEKITLGPSITTYEVTCFNTALREYPETYSLFDADSLRHIEIHNDNPNFRSVDGVLFSKDGTLIKYPPQKTGKIYSIPQFVKTVREEAFRNCTVLQHIELPHSITTIGRGTFMGCSSLVSITIPNGVIEIPEETFISSSKLATIFLSGNVTDFPNNAIDGCSNLGALLFSHGEKYTEIIALLDNGKNLKTSFERYRCIDY